MAAMIQLRRATRLTAWCVAIGLWVAACGGGGTGGDSTAAPAANSEAGPVSASEDAVAHERFQKANAEALQLMIAAAQRELEIAEFQVRISAATMSSMRSMSSAADAMEQVVADLKEALGQ